MTRPLVPAVAALIVALAPVPAAAQTAEPDDSGTGGLDYPRGGEGPEGSEVAFTFRDPRIAESSGLAPSAVHDGVWWTHNDSGDFLPDVYAVNQDGETLATVSLAVELRDWEAVAVAEGPDGRSSVYVADIGDNFGGSWPSVRVFRFAEPEPLADALIEPQVFTFTYADGGRDAEAMMIDPRDGRLYVVSKEFAGGLYAAPETLDPDAENVLERVDSAPLFATDAAFHPDGTRYAIRTYWGVTIYDSTDGVPGSALGSFDLPESDQGEAISFTPDGTALMAGTEGESAPVWSVPLADEYLSEVPAETPEESASADDEAGAGAADDREGGALPFILGGAGVAALLIAGIIVLARRG
ncbi:hypothetical protein [Nocardiopsis sp. NRRL B-16309]|uniref:hypothetical protein n=1 Tax=Nocardiopsis sp. NRRL B-16309 TaxID=1519494 RepID=UPI0006ADA31A|nr:hypothetical protein [Nocardiopsis sp. NRRL B-16309]KOX16973.1 hypothetical protein ADL05_10260 [Nocardiopsis sp. NRRL B-16309]